jgi:hypothetical protein
VLRRNTHTAHGAVASAPARATRSSLSSEGTGEGSNLRLVHLATAAGRCGRAFTNAFPGARPRDEGDRADPEALAPP